MENEFQKNLEQKINHLLKKMDELQCCPEIRRHWMPAKELQNLLGYKVTRFQSVIKDYNLELLEINKKKFLSVASIEKMFKIQKK
jgi:hypothetical protein